MAGIQYGGDTISCVAAAAIERGQVLEVTTWPAVRKAASDDSLALGIAMSDAANGETVDVAVKPGVYTVTGTASKGEALSCDADGTVVTLARTKPCIGHALEDGTAEPMLIKFTGQNFINTHSGD
jgi:predicted RecA/RadA family phage recombinase